MARDMEPLLSVDPALVSEERAATLSIVEGRSAKRGREHGKRYILQHSASWGIALGKILKN